MITLKGKAAHDFIMLTQEANGRPACDVITGEHLAGCIHAPRPKRAATKRRGGKRGRR